MKRQIRRGCFETNSSSMHSLVITKEDRYFTREECEESAWVRDGKLKMNHLSELEFDRSPFDLLTSFNDKLRYAIASLCGSYTEKEVADKIFEDEFLPIIKEVLLEVVSVDFIHGKRTFYYDFDRNEIPGDIWDDETGEPYCCDDNEKNHPEDREEDLIEYGYVDHQSMGLLKGFLKEEGISLKEFLTNKKYVVVIDGDEYCTFDKLKEANLINLDWIVKEYPPEGGAYDEYLWRKEKENEKTDTQDGI